MAQIKSYYELINAFRAFADDHKQIKCFGYGSISDIETPVNPSTGLPVQRDYPYFFVNPTNHTYTNSMLTYRFNVIVMELTTETTPTGFVGIHSTIKAQSDALLILNDFMAWLEYNTDFDTQLVKNSGFTPFQERFQDTVAGMTATIEIQIPNKLDLCDAPLYDDEQLVLAVQNLPMQILDSTSGEITGTAIYEVGNLWDGVEFTSANYVYDPTFGTIELRGDVTLLGATEAFRIQLDHGGVITLIEPTLVQWPNAASVNMNVPVKLVWKDLTLDYQAPDTFKFVVADGTSTPQILLENLQIKVYQA